METGLAELTMTPEEAAEHLERYKAFSKERKKGDPRYGQTMDILRSLVAGTRVIDVGLAITEGPKDADGRPLLALARADWELVFTRQSRGGVSFSSTEWGHWDGRTTSYSIDGPFEHLSRLARKLVPMIPPGIHPGKSELRRHTILFDVEKWDPMPPTDPYLLREISFPIFKIVGEWDLTPAEKMAMRVAGMTA